MKATQSLHDAGQSLWLDNISRGILDDGTLAGYIRDLSVTGLTSNWTWVDSADAWFTLLAPLGRAAVRTAWGLRSLTSSAAARRCTIPR